MQAAMNGVCASVGLTLRQDVTERQGKREQEGGRSGTEEGGTRHRMTDGT